MTSQRILEPEQYKESALEKRVKAFLMPYQITLQAPYIDEVKIDGEGIFHVSNSGIGMVRRNFGQYGTSNLSTDQKKGLEGWNYSRCLKFEDVIDMARFCDVGLTPETFIEEINNPEGYFHRLSLSNASVDSLFTFYRGVCTSVSDINLMSAETLATVINDAMGSRIYPEECKGCVLPEGKNPSSSPFGEAMEAPDIADDLKEIVGVNQHNLFVILKRHGTMPNEENIARIFVPYFAHTMLK